MSLFRGLVTNLQTLLGINHIYQMKLMHKRVKQFLPFMCKAMRAQDSSYPVDDVKNEKGQTLLQIATECRHHKVYNFIYD
ncbi:hypothetical protein ACFX1T_022323 [Malus domestica]